MVVLSPILPWPILVFFFVVVTGVSALGYRRLVKRIKRGYLAGLLSLRAMSLAGLGLLLFNPSLRRLVPDPAALNILILADCSGSMGVVDAGRGAERFQTVRDVIKEVKDSPSVFGNQVEKQGFNERLFPFLQPVQPLGRSGLGDALNAVIKDGSYGMWGAVILVSDGNWNAGESPVRSAAEFGRRGLPVSCVFAGGRDVPEDLSITSETDTMAVDRGQTCPFTFTLKSSIQKAQSLQVVFSKSGTELARQTVTMAAGQQVKEIHFQDTVWQFGNHVYSARLVSSSMDSIPENNVAFQRVEVAPPEEFKVAFLSGSVSWDFKMIRHVLEASEQFDMSAMMQTGKNGFFRSGDFLEKESPALPRSLKDLSPYDLVVLRYDALPLMGEDAGSLLEAFVDKRGGGLLVMGDDKLPAELGGLLPVRAAAIDTPPGHTAVDISDERIFPPGTAVSLYTAPGVRLPKRFPVAEARRLKPSSRPVLSIGDSRHVLAVQHFGGGRVGWLGFEGTWRWPLAGGGDKNRHAAFWQQLSVWLASGSKPRIHLPVDGKTVRIGEQLMLTAQVLDADYQPVTQGEVRGRLSRADGTVEELQLSPSPGHPGRFEMPVSLLRAGEYKLTVGLKNGKNDNPSAEAYFIASHGGREMNNPVGREDVLRDISRVSGGRFFNRDEVPKLRKGVPVSTRVPKIEANRQPTQSVFYGLLLLACLGGEWYGRRRIGLK